MRLTTKQKRVVQTKALKRRRLIILTVSVYAFVALTLLVLNLIAVSSRITIDISAWKLTFQLGDRFPDAGFFNGETLEDLVLSNFNQLVLPPGEVTFVSVAPAPVKTPFDSRSEGLRIRANAYGRCLIGGATLSSLHLVRGTDVTMARNRQEPSVLILGLDSPNESPTGQIVLDARTTVRCNAVAVEHVTSGEADVVFDYKATQMHTASFDGARPLSIAMEWKASPPELHERNTDIAKLSFVDLTSRQQSNTTVISGNIFMNDIEKQLQLGPADSLVLEDLSHFKIEDLALDAQHTVIHIRATGQAGRVVKNGSSETPSLLQWIDAQHKWTRWYVLVGVVGLTIINVLQFLRG